MSSWLDKAKEAAGKAAEEAKKFAETAKNANYGEMFDKTKNMAKQAAEEARKAAANVASAIKKDEQNYNNESLVDTTVTKEAVSANANKDDVNSLNVNKGSCVGMAKSNVDDVKLQECKQKLTQVEQLLKEIRNLLG